LKLKSTSGKRGPDESGSEDGLSYDGYGYGCSLPHFLNLLRSSKFRELADAASNFSALKNVSHSIPQGSETFSNEGLLDCGQE
jgi:hypothetical protein